jgi:hypothetical protein
MRWLKSLRVAAPLSLGEFGDATERRGYSGFVRVDHLP